MSAAILQFISRGEQLRKRGMDNYSHWKRITKKLEPFGPAERHRLHQRNVENESRDREWAMKHAPGPDGAKLLSFM
jgi:hypothetical protein